MSPFHECITSQNQPTSNKTSISPLRVGFMCSCSGRGEARRPGDSGAVGGSSGRADGPVRGAVRSAGKGKLTLSQACRFQPVNLVCREATHRTPVPFVLQLQNEIILCEPDFCENPQQPVRWLYMLVADPFSLIFTQTTNKENFILLKVNVSHTHIYIYEYYFFLFLLDDNNSSLQSIHFYDPQHRMILY